MHLKVEASRSLLEGERGMEMTGDVIGKVRGQEMFLNWIQA